MIRSATAAAILVWSLLAVGTGAAVTSSSTSGSLALVTSGPAPGVYRLDLAGRRLTRLTSWGRDDSPAWSRDGKQVAFIRTELTPERRTSLRLFVVNRDGSGLHVVGTMQAGNPTWGPGNREIAFVGRGGIWVVRPDGTGLKRLYASAAANDPAWSPDGRSILFGSGALGIFEMRSNGTGVHAIVRPPRSSRGHLYLWSAPAWAPSGKRFSFERLDGTASFKTGPAVMTANRDGSGQRVAAQGGLGLEASGVPTWSPDSASIAFVDVRGTGSHELSGVFVVPAGGGTVRLLYGPPGKIWSSPSWSPTG